MEEKKDIILEEYQQEKMLLPDPEKVNTCVHNLEWSHVRRIHNTIARYSVLNESDQLFAAKYMTYMPTEEELHREIEQQKEFFRLQNKEE